MNKFQLEDFFKKVLTKREARRLGSFLDRAIFEYGKAGSEWGLTVIHSAMMLELADVLVYHVAAKGKASDDDTWTVKYQSENFLKRLNNWSKARIRCGEWISFADYSYIYKRGGVKRLSNCQVEIDFNLLETKKWTEKK